MGVRASAAGAALLVACACAPAALGAPLCSDTRWIGAWSASPSDSAHDGFTGQTIREIVTPHAGGDVLRLRLTNRLGAAEVKFESVTVGLRRSGAELLQGSVHPVTFGGRRVVTIGAGGEVVSDPVELTFSAFQDLAVSLYTAGATGSPTEHYIARQTSYVTAGGSGDHSGDTAPGAFGGRLSSWFFLSGIDVKATAASGSVAAFGDSITDGFTGGLVPVSEARDGFDQNLRYPDFLARRLLEGGVALSVLNDGITGNRLLRDGYLPQFGPSALSRLDPDVIAQSGVTTAIVLLGINDIGLAWPETVTAADLEAGFRQLIARLRGAGVRVVLGTLTPTGRSPIAGYGSDEANATREQVNAWIRSAGAADGVVDFDAALRDPADPRRLAPQFDSGDHLHPSIAGYRRMAEVVDFAALARPSCESPKPKRRAHRRHKRHRRHHRRS